MQLNFPNADLASIVAQPKENMIWHNAPGPLTYSNLEDGTIVGRIDDMLWHMVLPCGRAEIYKVTDSMALSFVPDEGAIFCYIDNVPRLPIN